MKVEIDLTYNEMDAVIALIDSILSADRTLVMNGQAGLVKGAISDLRSVHEKLSEIFYKADPDDE